VVKWLKVNSEDNAQQVSTQRIEVSIANTAEKFHRVKDNVDYQASKRTQGRWQWLGRILIHD
jgi:hypothetical protein